MRYLDYYTAPDANGDTVLVGITDLETPPLTGVLTASDAALTTAATAAGHSTWDQETICSLYGLHRKPAMIVMPPPPPPAP
jgi:hypothetical protein